MGLTQVSTDGVKNDAITKAKIPANQIEASELADNAVDTNAIADQAVALSKLPHGDGSSDGKFLRANNGADPTFETVSTTPADGSITQAKLNFPVANRNLIINGAMQVAQRGTSSNSSGYQTVDRFSHSGSGWDEAMAQIQGTVGSGVTPYELGFRKTFKIQNGNQSSGAGSNDYLHAVYAIEDQDLATSGWNYTSASSHITFSFWVKSSVAQNFYFYFQSDNNSQYRYVMETGSLSANTWTKVTKTIPGNSNIVLNSDNGVGMFIVWNIFDGTDRTGTRPLNAWAVLDNANRTPDQTSTWYTTNNATFEITGVQLEVGSVSTDFEHKSFAQELALCERYYQDSYEYHHLNAQNGESDRWIRFRTEMRAGPSVSTSPTNSVSFGVHVATANGFSGDGSGNGHANFNLGWTASSEL